MKTLNQLTEAKSAVTTIKREGVQRGGGNYAHFGTPRGYEHEEHDVFHKGEHIGHVYTHSGGKDDRELRWGGSTRGASQPHHKTKADAIKWVVKRSTIKEDVVIEATGKRKKFLGKHRGTTATGQRANAIDTEPTIKGGKDLKSYRTRGR